MLQFFWSLRFSDAPMWERVLPADFFRQWNLSMPSGGVAETSAPKPQGLGVKEGFRGLGLLRVLGFRILGLRV